MTKPTPLRGRKRQRWATPLVAIPFTGNGASFRKLRSSAIDVFFSDAVNSELRFSRDAAGAIRGLVLVQEGQEQVASKKV